MLKGFLTSLIQLASFRGVGTGLADPAAAGPKFALSIKIETHNSKKVNCLKSTQLRLMQLAISVIQLIVSSDKAKLQWPLTFLHAIIFSLLGACKNNYRSKFILLWHQVPRA